jgi:predicted DsbA family dithiol-disulfide isomerase
MRIDIWSDVMCPFCYIGKRKLEQALDSFEHKNDVEVVWHSFQLDPDMQPQPGTDIYGYLAERKGQSREWSVSMHKNMEQMAAKDGLEYNFSKAVPANSFNAHRLIQLAKTQGLGDAAEERLFKAYFTEGKDINNTDTLQQIGMELGLSAVTVGEMLNSSAFATEVHADVQRAAELGINGVPFFVLNNKYGISGAQPASLFSDALQQAWVEYETAQGITTLPGNGPVCTDDSC